MRTQKDKFKVIPSPTRARDPGPGWCEAAEGSRGLHNRKRKADEVTIHVPVTSSKEPSLLDPGTRLAKATRPTSLSLPESGQVPEAISFLAAGEAVEEFAGPGGVPRKCREAPPPPFGARGEHPGAEEKLARAAVSTGGSAVPWEDLRNGPGSGPGSSPGFRPLTLISRSPVEGAYITLVRLLSVG